MSKRQTQKMLQLMASGEPVELTSPMASVKKLARLAFVAQQFGYEYADVRQGGGSNSSLRMLLVPDPGPQARSRAAQNWAQYPNAGDGVSVPPLVPDAFELLKARINFDLTGKNAEKRMGYGALGVTVGCVVLAYRFGGASGDFVVAAIVWLCALALLGVGFLVTRKRNAKFAARLQAAGFVPVADETGRVRYLAPGAQPPGHGNPFGGAGGPVAGGAPYGYPQAPAAPGGYGQPAPGPYAPQQPPYPARAGYGQSAPGPYAPQQPPYPARAGYGQSAPGPYAPQQPPHPAQAGYGQQPQAPQQQPYPAQAAQPSYGQPQPQPYAPPQTQQPYPQQPPHGQPRPPQS
ncbi:hypothetical protein KBY55_13485 [Streptomyces sp. b94]|uniref:hypothetical protein n=1 Tax=Streptomyces sp. b94 TaxID=1827634 RepID=UPI001B394E68|nr:hypothetical protein [Streptomyces sp. b94]MBQ1097084.1 hypothetical protein [Streptomyces sp. b94]